MINISQWTLQRRSSNRLLYDTDQSTARSAQCSVCSQKRLTETFGRDCVCVLMRNCNFCGLAVERLTGFDKRVLRKIFVCVIWGSHSGRAKDSGLL